jgi:hypothetical protein
MKRWRKNAMAANDTRDIATTLEEMRLRMHREDVGNELAMTRGVLRGVVQNGGAILVPLWVIAGSALAFVWHHW